MGLWCLDCNNPMPSKFDTLDNKCLRCGSHNVIDVPQNGITVGDILAIEEISKDKDFVMAMLKLKQENCTLVNDVTPTSQK